MTKSELSHVYEARAGAGRQSPAQPDPSAQLDPPVSGGGVAVMPSPSQHTDAGRTDIGRRARAGSHTRARSRRHPLAKTLTCALAALSVAAGMLLAVALDEPVPAAAQSNPSAQPTVALKDHTSLHTQSSTPTFVVTDVANNATVKVEASRNARTVSKSGTVGASDTMVEIPFTGSTCDTSDDTDTTADEACTLAEGAWAVVVTHTESSKDPATREVTIWVDTAAPEIAIVNPGTSPATSKTFSAYDGDADGVTTWMSRVQSESVCAAAAPTGGADPAVSYTERDDLTLSSEDDNGKYVCFWSTDAAGNTAVRRSAAVAGIELTGPTLTISIGPDDTTALNFGDTLELTFTASEPIKDFDLSSITNSNTSAATLSDFVAVSSTVYTVTLTADDDTSGTVTLSVAAGAFTDLAGNDNPAPSGTDGSNGQLEITVQTATATPVIGTSTPTASSTITGGSVTVAGTTTEADGTSITVSVGAGLHKVTDTVVSASGAWTTDLDVSKLSGTQTITVIATAVNKGTSAEATREISVTAATVPANHTSVEVVDSDARSGSIGELLDVTYTLIPEAGSCGSITEPDSQNEASGIRDADGDITHHLDYRCDWQVSFTHAQQCKVRLIPSDIASSQSHTDAVNSFTLTGDETDMQLEQGTDEKVTRISVGTDRADDCQTELIVAAKDGTSLLDNTGLDISYTLTFSGCSGFSGPENPSNESRTDATVESANYQHDLETRCTWTAAFTAPAVPGKCLAVDVAYVANDGTTTTHASAGATVVLTPDPENSRLVYGAVADAKAVNRLLLSYIDEVTTITNSYGYDVPYRQCASPVRFRPQNGSQGDVLVTLVPKTREKVGETTQNGQTTDVLGSPTDCTPNGRSDNPSGPITLGRAVTYNLGHNCNWNVVFGAASSECRAYAEFYSGANRLFIRVPKVSEGNTSIGNEPLVLEPYVLDSRHNATTTFLLKGEDDYIRYSLSQLQDVTLPGSRPTITAEHPNVVLRTGSTMTMKLTLSHPVTGFTKEDIKATPNWRGTVTNLAKSPTDDTSYTVTLTAGSNTGRLTVSVPANSFKTASGGVQNLAQTPFTWSNLQTLTPDPVFTAPGDNTRVRGTVTVSGTLASVIDDGHGGTQDRVFVTFGPLGQKQIVPNVSAKTWTTTFDTSSLGVVEPEAVVIRAHTVRNGNSSTTLTRTVTVDHQPPTVASPIATANVKVGGTVTVPLTVSEAAADFDDLTDVSVDDTSKATVASISGSGSDYMVTLNGVAAGSTTVSVPAGGFTDVAGNNNLAGTNLLAVTVGAQDVTAAPAITEPVANAVVGGMVRVAGTAETANDSVTVSFGSLPSQTVMADASKEWSATFNTAALDIATTAEVELSATAQASGEASSLPHQVTVVVDKQRPTVASSIALAKAQVGGTVTVPLKVSETTADFAAADISVAPSNVATVASLTGSGTDYTLTLNGVAEGTAVVSLNANGFADSVGNQNLAADVVTVDVGATAVTATPVITNPVADGLPAEEPLVVVGTAEANAAVTVSLNSVPHKTVAADSSGDWSAELEDSSLAAAAAGGGVVISVTAQATGKAVSSTVQRTAIVVETRKSAIVDYSITAISFSGCNNPHEDADETRGVAFVAGGGYRGGVHYKLELNSRTGSGKGCDGYNAAPASYEGEVLAAGNKFSVNRFCNWKVTFYREDTCKFDVGGRENSNTNLELGSTNLDLPSGATRGTVVYDDITPGTTHKIYTVSNHAVTGGECASDLTLKNTAAAGAGKAVAVAFTPLDTDGNGGSCMPHGRGPDPDGGNDIIIEAGASTTVTLARNCNWKVEFSSQNAVCAATALLKQPGGGAIQSVTATTDMAGGTKTSAGELVGEDERLKHPSLNVAVGQIDFDGCSAQVQPADTAEVTVVDAAAGLDFTYSFAIVANSCASAAGTPDAQDQDDAIVTGANRVHYLDDRCNWTFTANSPEMSPNSCPVTATALGASDTALMPSNTGTTATLTLSKQATASNPSRLLLGTDTVEKVRVSFDTGSATCFLALNFVNVSTPFPTTSNEYHNPALPELNRQNPPQGQVEYDLPYPRMHLRLLPHNNGNACSPNSGGFVATKGDGTPKIVAIDAAAVNPSSRLTYLPNSEDLKLAGNCDWTVEFTTDFYIVDEAEDMDITDTMECSSSARVKDRAGMALGNPVAGSPQVGGSFVLEASANGLTFTPPGGDATLVGSVEFLGCLEVEYRGSSLVQIFDDAAPAGDLSYTISPAEDGNGETTCDGFAPPASQTEADGLVTPGVPGSYAHYLNLSCDWVVTFTGTNECEAMAVWNFTDAGSLEYLDSVLADPANPGTLSVRLHQHHDPDHESGQSNFVYYLGSGTTTPGGLRYASDGAGTGLAGPAPEADQAGGLPSAPGLYTGPGQQADINAPADSDTMVSVNALSLECVSDIEFSNISGLQGQLLNIKAATPTVSDLTSTGAATCHTTQTRLPDASTLRSAESFVLALNVKCDWNVQFKMANCRRFIGINNVRSRLQAKVYDNAATPVEIDTRDGLANAAFETIALTASPNGLQYTPTGGAATAVGAIEFYGCFYPSVSVDVPGVVAGDELNLVFTRVGSDPDCTVSTTMTLRLRSGERVNLSNAEGTTLIDYLINNPRGFAPSLFNLDSNGNHCQYKATVTGPARLGALTTTNLISGAHGYLTVIQPREVVPLTFTNATADKGAVEVTTTPQAVCPQAAPAASPYTVAASASVTAMLGYQDCVWTIAYANDNECDVSAQLKDADGTAIGSADTDGSLEITTHSRTGSSTPVSSIEFTVMDNNCTSQTTTATVAVAVTINDALNADFMGASFDIEFTKISGPATGCQVGGMEVGTGVGNGHTETVAITSGRTRTVNVTVVDVPDGETTHCSYYVHFPASATHNGITLNRTAPGSSGQISVAPEVQTSPIAASGSYTAVRPASTKPTVALTGASDTGPGANDGRYTMTRLPTFKVTATADIPVGANVTVRAVKGNETIERTLENLAAADITSGAVAVEFTAGTDCSITTDPGGGGTPTVTTGQSCSLSDGDWMVTAIHQQTSTSLLNTSDAITITVVNTGPAPMLAASPATLDVASSVATGATSTLTLTVPASVAPLDLTAALNASSDPIVTMTGSGGSLGDFSRASDGLTYMATFTSSGIGTASFTVAANAFQDAAGNQNTALATPATIAVQVAPVVLTLRNTTSDTLASDSRYTVTATPSSSSSACQSLSQQGQAITIAAGASASVSLGSVSDACTWTVAFSISDTAACGITASVADSSDLEVQAQGITESGSVITEITYSVACTTTFDTGTVAIALTDSNSPQGDHSSVAIPITVARAGSADSLCTASKSGSVDLTDLSSASSTPTTITDEDAVTGLVDLPKGDATKQCEYTVTFPPNYIAGSVRYRRTGPATATLKNGTTASSAYEVLDAAAGLELRNITASSGVHTGMTSRSGARVSVHPVAPIPGTSPIQACIDVAPHEEYDSSDATTYAALPAGATATPTPVAAASMQLALGTGDPACQFEVEFVNADQDCKVFAQLKDEAGMNIGSAPLANTAGNITLFTKTADQFKVFYHDGTNEHTVGSIDFSVPDPSDNSADPAGACNTTFTGTISIEVTDTDNSGDHEDTVFAVTVADGAASNSSALACTTGIPNQTLTLGSNKMASEPVKDAQNTTIALVGSLYDGESCSYGVTFPPSATSMDADMVLLIRQGLATDSISEDTPSNTNADTVSRTYVAARTPSKEPTLVMAAASDTGSTETASPYFTQTRTPTFTVTFATAVTSSTVSVEASDGTNSVSQTMTNASGASFTFNFTGSTCYRNGSAAADQSCSLADAEWTVTATNTDSVTHAPATDDITVKVDNARPQVTVSVSSAMVPVEGLVSLTFAVSDAISAKEEVTGFELSDVLRPTSGGVLTDRTISGSTFPDSDGDFIAYFVAGNTVGASYTIEVPADQFMDLAGNSNMGTGVLSPISIVKGPRAVELVNSASSSLASNSAFNAVVALELSNCDTSSNDATSGPYTVRAGATVTVPFPDDNCDLELTHNAPSSDCAIATTPATGASRELSLQVMSGQAAPTATGGAAVATVTYNVTCTTTFAGMVEITLEDFDSADHSAESISVQVAPVDNSHAACLTETVSVDLGDHTAATPETTTTGMITGLVDLPQGLAANQCRYVVTFPADPASSTGSIRYRRTGAKTAMLSNGVTAASAYQANREAVLVISNQSTGFGGIADAQTRAFKRGVGVEVSLANPDGFDVIAACRDAAPYDPDALEPVVLSLFAEADANPTDAMNPTSSQSGAFLSAEDCDGDNAFVVNYYNGSGDCRVFAQLKDLEGNNIGDEPLANFDGTFTLTTSDLRLLYTDEGTLPDTSDDQTSVVGSIEFTVPDPADSTASPAGVCNTTFTATVEVDVEDRRSGADHEDTEFEVTIANGVPSDQDLTADPPQPGSFGCSSAPPPQNFNDPFPENVAELTLTLDANNEASDTVTLVGELYTGATCSYAVTFPVEEASEGSAPDNVNLGIVGSTTASLDKDTTTLSRTYLALRSVEFVLSNQTGDNVAAHVVDGMENITVAVAPADPANCSETAPAAASPHTINDGEAPGIDLGTANCAWNFTYRNTESDCQVEAQLKALDDSNLAYADADDNDGSFTLYTYGHRLRTANSSSGAVVGAAVFTVSSACDTFFDGQITLTVTDTEAATHSDALVVTVAETTGTATGCSDSRNVDVTLGAATVAGATFPATTVANLINVPVNPTTGTALAACSYTATFEANETVGTGGSALTFERDSASGETGTLSDASKSVSASYDVVRDVVVELSNITTGTHTPTTRSGVEVSVTSASCSVSAPTNIPDPLAASGNVSVNLGQASCDWTVSYENVADDCTVKVTLEDLAGNAIAGFADSNDGTSANDGSFTLYIDDMSKRRLRTADGGAGTAVGAIKFEVPVTDSSLTRAGETCETDFSQTVSIATTDAPGVSGTHTGTTVDVEVRQQIAQGASARSECSAAAGTVKETVTLDASGAGMETFTGLIDKPLGLAACEYEAVFPSPVPSTDANNLQLNRTSAAAVEFDGASQRAGTAVAGAYQAVSSALIKLANKTTGTTHPLDSMRQVKVTLTPTTTNDCTATVQTVTIAAAAVETVALGREQCVWTIGFANLNADCLATAQLRGSDETTAVESLVAPTVLSGGSVTINVDSNRATRSGSVVGSGTVVGAVDFDVPTASCATVFDATVSVSVTDTVSAVSVHEDTELVLTVARQTGELEQCVVHGLDAGTDDKVTLTLLANGTAEAMLQLVNVPHGQAAGCDYDVTFPSPVTSEASGDPQLLNQGAAAGVLSASSTSLTREYDAVRPARVILENATTVTHTPATRGTVSVTLTPSACTGQGTAPVEFAETLGAAGSSEAAKTVALGTHSCTWTVKFSNPDTDCAISAELKDADDRAIANSQTSAADGNGSLTMYTGNRRPRQGSSSGTVVDTVEFAVGAECTTFFDGELSVTVTDTQSGGDHTGSMFPVTVMPQAASAGCTAADDSKLTGLMVTLDQQLTGSLTVAGLVNKPLNRTECSYTVTFTDAQVASAVSSIVQLERQGANNGVFTVSAPTSQNADADTAAITYDAVRAATVKLVNATTAAHASDTHRRTVIVKLASSNCSGPGTAATPADQTLTAGDAAVSVALGTQTCTWTITVNTTQSDCRVAAQLQDASSMAIGSADNDGSVTVYVVGRRTRSENTGAGTEVATIEFKVPETPLVTCTTHFTARFPVTITDTRNGDHTGSTIDITVAPQPNQDNRCTQQDTTTATLNAALAGTGSIRLVSVPLGRNNACLYVATFPDTASSVLSGIQLERVGGTSTATATIEPGVSSAPVIYDAVRAATVSLDNITTASHTPADRSAVKITPSSGGCAVSQTSEFELTTSARSQMVTLGTAACAWTFSFQNTAADCAVAAQLREADGTIIRTVTATGGTAMVTLYVNANRRTMSAASGGSEVATVEFNVPATPASSCTTYFTASFPITVTDTRNGDHSNSTIEIPIAAVSGSHANCTRSATATATLTSALAGTGTQRLVDTVLGQASGCSYRASFPATAASVLSGIQLERTSDTAATATVNASSASAAATYDAIRAATVNLRNATTASLTPATRRTVALTPATTCAAASERAAFNLAVSATPKSVTLGTADCTWAVSFANPADDCVVSAQLKNTSGANIGAAVTNRPTSSPITLHVINRRTMSAASGGSEVGSIEFAVSATCDTSFDGSVSISVTDTLDPGESDRNHVGTPITVTVTPTGGSRCSASASQMLMLNASNTATAAFAGLVNMPAGLTACVYRVSFDSPVNSVTNSRVQLINTNQGAVTLSGSATSAQLTYEAELIPEPPVASNVSVSPAVPVMEGEPLVFNVGLPGPAMAAVEVSYSVSGGTAAESSTGTVTIAAGQSATVISVPTDDDELDEANQTVRVTLTGVTGGGVTLDQFGRTATGVVRDNDPAPTVGITQASLTANRVRFTVELDAASTRDVVITYTTSLGTSGRILITAGETRDQADHIFSLALLTGRSSLRLRLATAQYATIDPEAREQLLFPEGEEWQFHTTSRAGVTPAQIASAFGLADGWKLYSWNTATQRWVEYTAASGGATRLAAGVAITFKGAPPEAEEVAEAGLGRGEQVTLRQGWNIFTPDPGAVGLTSRDFTQASGGASAVFFDPRLVDCEALAGVLVIYTYDQTDPQAQNGFRIALPCHPQVQADSGIPAITSIDANDTVYAWFNSTTPVTLQYANGRYSPA